MSLNWVIIGSGNGLSPVQHQDITLTIDNLDPQELQWNVNQNEILITENAFESVFCEMSDMFIDTPSVYDKGER